MKAWTQRTRGGCKKVVLDTAASKHLSHKLGKQCGKSMPDHCAETLLKEVKAELHIK